MLQTEENSRVTLGSDPHRVNARATSVDHIVWKMAEPAMGVFCSHAPRRMAAALHAVRKRLPVPVKITLRRGSPLCVEGRLVRVTRCYLSIDHVAVVHPQTFGHRRLLRVRFLDGCPSKEDVDKALKDMAKCAKQRGRASTKTKRTAASKKWGQKRKRHRLRRHAKKPAPFDNNAESALPLNEVPTSPSSEASPTEPTSTSSSSVTLGSLVNARGGEEVNKRTQENVDSHAYLSHIPLYMEIASLPACAWGTSRAIHDGRGNVSVFFVNPAGTPKTEVRFTDKYAKGCAILRPFSQYVDPKGKAPQMTREGSIAKLRRDLYVEPTANQIRWMREMESWARKQIATHENALRWFGHPWSLTEVEQCWRSVIDMDSTSKLTFRAVVCFNGNPAEFHAATIIKVWKETNGTRSLKGHGQGRDFVSQTQDARQWMGSTACMAICPWRLFYHRGNNTFTFMWRVTHLEITEAETFPVQKLTVTENPFEI